MSTSRSVESANNLDMTADRSPQPRAVRSSLRRDAKPIEVEIEAARRGSKCEQMTEDEPNPKWAADLGAAAEAQRQRDSGRN